MQGHELLYWDRLRSIGESRLVRLTILAPFVGYLILFNENLVQWLSLSTGLIPNESFQLFWQDAVPSGHEITSNRLFLIYFGLLFLGLGSICYGIACPYLLKSYGSASEYMRAEIGFLTRFQAQRMLEGLRELKAKPVGLEGLLDEFQRSFDRLVAADDKEGLENFSKDLMYEKWKADNSAHPVARWLTFAAYVLGFGILSLPAINTIMAVAKAFWG